MAVGLRNPLQLAPQHLESIIERALEEARARGASQAEAAALEELQLAYPQADRAALQKLLAKAERERLEQRPPVGVRELFAYLRQLLS